MKNFIKKGLQSLLLVPAIALGVGLIAPIATGSSAFALGTDTTTSTGCSGDVANAGIQGGAACAKGSGVSSNLFGNGGIFTTIVNILLYIIGAVAVIMLIIGGIRYVTSGGDSSAVGAAKNTILYAIIGIIVALLAYAIVNFVLGALVPGASNNG